MPNKKFKELKEKLGGDVASIMKYKAELPYKIYFDDQGNITYFGNSDVTPEDTWLTHDFTQDQLDVLKKHGTRKYFIHKDKIIDNLYSVQPRTYELTKRVVLHLEEIDISNEESDINCELHKDKIKIYLGEKIKNNIGKSSISAKTLYFYLTAKKDPHWLFETIEVPTDQLLHDDFAFDIQLEDRKESLSLYTKKIFDSYTLKIL